MRPTSATRCATGSTADASPSNSRVSPPSAPTKRPLSKQPFWKHWEKKRYGMPDEIELPDLPDPGSLRRGRFTYLPVVPGRLEFAIEVRQAILREKPPVVAVELPTTLQQHYLRAVARLPELS